MNAAIVLFPGTNRDRDMALALRRATGREPARLWHAATTLPDRLDLLVLPGGFAHGDYLRCGAMAARSPIMPAIAAFAARGGHILGVCNGFQILTEAQLLPGALLRNATLRFLGRDCHLRVERTDTAFTRGFGAAPHAPRDTVPRAFRDDTPRAFRDDTPRAFRDDTPRAFRATMAHGDGQYVADAVTLDRLEADGLVAFRYATPDGAITDAANPNGSARAIAGILSPNHRVCGLMPHPENQTDPAIDGEDGLPLFTGLAAALAAH